MNVVRVAVSCAVVALLAGHQFSTLGPARRAALWASARTMVGDAAARPQAPLARQEPLARQAPAAGQVPSAPPRVIPAGGPAWGGEETVLPDSLGQFQTAVEIGGQRLSVLVDTGASFVSLTFEDADRLGLRPAPADFRYAISTANGRAAVARVELPAVRLGSIEVRGVTALVSGRGQLSETLLGMSFLSRLSRFSVDHGRLVLAP